MVTRAFSTAVLGLILVGCGSHSPKVEATSPKPAAAAAVAPSMAIPPRKDDAERASKNGVTKGTVGGVSVEVHYGRPKVGGREVFGELVPYGSVWRTGANEATTLTLASEAKIGEKVVPAGTYALFTIPGEQEWTVILNGTAAQWGSFKYDEKADVARVKTAPEKVEATEEFTIEIEGDQLWLRWAETRVPLPITAA